MNKTMKWIGIAAAVILLAIFAIMYIDTHGASNLDNYPYEPDTPAPDPHEGVFVSDYGTMTFNGDDKTIIIDFNKELSELTGLPAGEHEGSYDFLSGNLPPHGSIPVRYDTAHEMEITVMEDGKEIRVVTNVGIASEDGKTGSIGIGMVTPERIPFLLKTDKGYITVSFEKK